MPVANRVDGADKCQVYKLRYKVAADGYFLYFFV